MNLYTRAVCTGTPRLGMPLATGAGGASSPITTPLRPLPHPATQFGPVSMRQLPCMTTAKRRKVSRQAAGMEGRHKVKPTTVAMQDKHRMEQVTVAMQGKHSWLAVSSRLQIVRQKAGSPCLMLPPFCWCMALGPLGSSGGAKSKPSLQPATRC